MTTTPEHRPNRSRAMVVGAVLVAATLVGTGAFMAIPDPRDAPGSEGLSQDQSLSTPEAVLAEAQRVLPDLAAGTDAADAATAAVEDAQRALDDAARGAHSAVLHHAAAQQGALDAAVADTAGLPTAPGGWLPGTDVAPYVGPVGSAPYAVPTLGAPVGVGGLTSLTGHTVGGSFATGGGAPGTGVSELDALVDQVALLDGTYDGLLGKDLGSVLGGLGGSGLPTDSLPAGLGALGGGLPGVPAPSDASGAVDPDDEGAQNALLFGYEVTDGVTTAFDDLDDQAADVLATHAGLLGEVEARAADARALEADGVADVEAQLQKRLADAQADTDAGLAALEAARDAYVQKVQAAGTDAQATLDAELADARSDLESEAQAQAQALVDAAGDALADAEARSASVDAQATEYLDLLAQMQADGADVTAQAAAVQAEADRLQAQIQSDAEAQQADLLAAAEELQAQAEEHLAGLDARVAQLPDLQAEAGDATAEAERLLAFGQAVALARNDAVDAAHAAAAQAAADDLRAQGDAQVAAVLGAAEAYLDRSDAFAQSGSTLVRQLQGDGTAHVDAAASYVREVAEDYSSVPDPDRQAAAEELLSEAETLSTVGFGVVASGDGVAQRFAAVAQSGEALRGQLSALSL